MQISLLLANGFKRKFWQITFDIVKNYDNFRKISIFTDFSGRFWKFWKCFLSSVPVHTTGGRLEPKSVEHYWLSSIESPNAWFQVEISFKFSEALIKLIHCSNNSFSIAAEQKMPFSTSFHKMLESFSIFGRLSIFFNYSCEIHPSIAPLRALI